MKQNKVLSLLGLAARSRNVVSGEFATENSVKEGKAKLVMVAVYGEKETLGHAMGKEVRSSLAITDSGFAKALMEQMETVWR